MGILQRVAELQLHRLRRKGLVNFRGISLFADSGLRAWGLMVEGFQA